MDVSTVIVSYNTFALTREAVRTALEAAPGLDHQVVVVDNDSPDGSGPRLRRAFSGDDRVVVIERADNLGFAAANNVGARVAAGRLLYFLNPDTVSHGDGIARLASFLDGHVGAGAVGPHVVNADGSDQPSTGRFDTALSLARHFLSLPAPHPRRDRPRPVDVVKGCALAVSRDAFDEVGGWDERYFMYAEENELCLALARSGRQNWFVPGARVTHYGGVASAERYVEHQLLAMQSATAFLRRHGSRGLVAFHRALGASTFAVRAVLLGAASRVRPDDDRLRQRSQAARALWRYLAFDHS